jgi:hypothetical protein
VAAIVYAIRHTPRPRPRERQPIGLRIRPVMRGELGRLLTAVSAFELGNIAATLLILRATDVLEPRPLARRGDSDCGRALPSLHVAATLASVPVGRLADSAMPVRVLALGVGAFAWPTLASLSSAPSITLLALFFIAAGIG